MPGAAPARPTSYDYDDDRPPTTQQGEDAPKSSKGKSKELKTDGKGRSWIGGILTKLSLRPPNQMILPDDKNPTIVWDADKKRWRNTDGTEEEGDRPPPPPPPPSHPHPHPHPPANASPPHPGASPPHPGAPPGVPVSNIFKMQKGRHIKKSYVDVFNPGGASPCAAPPPTLDVLGPPAPAPTNYFVPAAGSYEADGKQHPRTGI